MNENKYKLLPVLDSRRKRIPGLYTRNGRYYLRTQVKGKQRLLASPHDTKLDSMRWAKKKRGELRHGIEEPAPAPAVAVAEKPTKKQATIEALVDAYRKAAADRFAMFGGPQPDTVTTPRASPRRSGVSSSRRFGKLTRSSARTVGPR
jgi:hypothetical protein